MKLVQHAIWMDYTKVYNSNRTWIEVSIASKDIFEKGK